MHSALKLLDRAIHVLGALQLLLGIAVWSGAAVPWRGMHIATGLLFAATFVAVGAVAARRDRRALPLVAALAWIAIVVAYAFAHARLLPGDAHWVAQLLHVVIGLGTIGIAERLAAPARVRAA